MEDGERLNDRNLPPEDLGELLTVEELAARLKVRKSWVYVKTREGEIPTVRVGRHCRFHYPAVLQWRRGQGGRTRG